MNSGLENPLVSFIVLGFNQEKFIREAVESAFNQNYSPLEIIISDDCSTDNTFLIMNEMAASYVGPHSLVVRQSEKNQVTAKHFFSAAMLAKGELIIEAGGDDVSKPERAMKIVQAWQETSAWGFYSRFDKISEDGELLSENVYLSMKKHAIRKYWLHGDEIALLHGAVSAYTKKAVMLIGNDMPSILTEDGVGSVALHLHDKPIYFLNESLVRYRVNPLAVSNSGHKIDRSYSDIIESEYKASRIAFYFKNFNDWLLKYKSKIDSVDGSRAVIGFNESEVMSDIHLYSMMKSWIDDSSFSSRVEFLIKYPRLTNWRWMVPRLFGLKVFSYFKYLINKLR